MKVSFPGRSGTCWGEVGCGVQRGRLGIYQGAMLGAGAGKADFEGVLLQQAVGYLSTVMPVLYH